MKWRPIFMGFLLLCPLGLAALFLRVGIHDCYWTKLACVPVESGEALALANQFDWGRGVAQFRQVKFFGSVGFIPGIAGGITGGGGSFAWPWVILSDQWVDASRDCTITKSTVGESGENVLPQDIVSGDVLVHDVGTKRESFSRVRYYVRCKNVLIPYDDEIYYWIKDKNEIIKHGYALPKGFSDSVNIRINE